MTSLKKLILRTVAVATISVAPSNAALSIQWDFSPGNENGWTTVNGVSWLEPDGVEAGQANGVDGNTGGTRKGHDGPHTNFIYRSPTISFGSVDATGPVLEIDWIGGVGNQDNRPNPANPAAIIGGGLSTAVGSKGVALLNLTTGDYDAVYYNTNNANPAVTNSLTLTDLTTAGVSTTDNYQLDFFDTDDGSWGWSRMSEMRLDGNAVVTIPEPSSFALFGLAGFTLICFRRRK